MQDGGAIADSEGKGLANVQLFHGGQKRCLRA